MYIVTLEVIKTSKPGEHTYAPVQVCLWTAQGYLLFHPSSLWVPMSLGIPSLELYLTQRRIVLEWRDPQSRRGALMEPSLFQGVKRCHEMKIPRREWGERKWHLIW